MPRHRHEHEAVREAAAHARAHAQAVQDEHRTAATAHTRDQAAAAAVIPPDVSRETEGE